MNLGEMKTALKRYGFDDSDPLSLWLNAAMHDVEMVFDWPWLEAQPFLYAAEAGSNLIWTSGPISPITPPVLGNISKVMSIRDLSYHRKLVYWDRHRFTRDIERPEEVGAPEIYTLINSTSIQFWRVLQVPTTFELLLQYVTPDMLNSTDEPYTFGNVWPAMTHYAIVQRAASIALQAENEEERAKTAEAQYEASLERLRTKFGERELDEPLTVTDAQNYASNAAPNNWVGW